MKRVIFLILFAIIIVIIGVYSYKFTVSFEQESVNKLQFTKEEEEFTGYINKIRNLNSINTYKIAKQTDVTLQDIVNVVSNTCSIELTKEQANALFKILIAASYDLGFRKEDIYEILANFSEENLQNILSKYDYSISEFNTLLCVAAKKQILDNHEQKELISVDTNQNDMIFNLNNSLYNENITSTVNRFLKRYDIDLQELADMLSESCNKNFSEEEVDKKVRYMIYHFGNLDFLLDINSFDELINKIADKTKQPADVIIPIVCK